MITSAEEMQGIYKILARQISLLILLLDVGFAITVYIFIAYYTEYDRYTVALLVLVLCLTLQIFYHSYCLVQRREILLNIVVPMDVFGLIGTLLLMRMIAQEYSHLGSQEHVHQRFKIEEYITILLRIRDSGILLWAIFATDIPRFALFIILALQAYTAPLLLQSIPAGAPVELGDTIGRIIFNSMVSLLVVEINKNLRRQWKAYFQKGKELKNQFLDEKARFLEANHRAISLIHHGMKNICASIAATCEVAMSDKNLNVGDLRKEMHRIVGLASMGFSLCNKRAKMAMIESSSFRADSYPVDCLMLANYMTHLSPYISVRNEADNLPVALGDKDVIYFLLENALANGVKWGLENAPMHIILRTTDTQVRILVKNTVATNFCLRHNFEIKQAFLNDEPSIKSQEMKLSPLANEILIAEMAKTLSKSGDRQENLFMSSMEAEELRKTISEGRGLRIIKACCRKAGYGCRFYQERNQVVLSLELPIAPIGMLSGELDPSLLRITYSSEEKAKPPRICCVEDEVLIRKMYKRVLIKKYFDPSSVVLGKTKEETQKAAEFILKGGFRAVILDQNLVYDGELLLGTDILKELRTCGFTGVILMRSANNEPADIDLYIKSGADGVLSKSETSAKVAAAINAALEERSRRSSNPLHFAARTSMGTAPDATRVSYRVSNIRNSRYTDNNPTEDDNSTVNDSRSNCRSGNSVANSAHRQGLAQV